MTKWKKVIKGLECRLDINGSKYKHCLTCDYRHDIDHCQWACQTDGILEDALALLKAHEPKPPVVKENSYGWKFYYCPSCGKEFYQNNKFSFCEKCGQAVKWE